MSRATREAYGETLVELVREGHDIMAVDADLAGSTKLADFQKAFPKRFAIPCVIPVLMSRFALLMRELR